MGNILYDNMLEQKELELFNFIQKHCIYRARVKYGEFHLQRWTSKGIVQDGVSQFYPQRMLMNPAMTKIVGDLFWERCWDIWEERKFQIAGIESCSIPIISAILSSGMWLSWSVLGKTHGLFDINGFYIRKEKKQYGLCNWTEGIIQPNIPVMLVDDISNSKGQMARAHTILTELGHEVLPVAFSVFKFPHRQPVKENRFIFSRSDFSTQHGERWEDGTYDYSIDLDIEFNP